MKSAFLSQSHCKFVVLDTRAIVDGRFHTPRVYRLIRKQMAPESWNDYTLDLDTAPKVLADLGNSAQGAFVFAVKRIAIGCRDRLKGVVIPRSLFLDL